MAEVIHILHLEDDAQDSQLMADLLEQGGIRPKVERVQTLEAFLASLHMQPLDLIVSDYTVPGTDVLDALRAAHAQRPEVPFVFLSGTIREDLAIETLKNGATDYVLKEQISRLVPAVRRALHEAREQAQRRKSEEDLARTTARFDGIISSAMDAIISIDAEQKVLLFNPAAEKMFRISAEDALGKSIEQFLPARYRVSHARDVQAFGRTGISNRSMGRLGALTAVRSTGEEFPIEASISQVEVHGEKLFTVILRDITERKRTEEGLKKIRDELSQANARLEQEVQRRTAELVEANANLQTFAYTAAHDLRAPLRSISNFSKIIAEDFAPKLGAEGQGLLERVTAASDQMSRLLDSLLEYSRITAAATDLTEVDLARAVREALSFLEADIKAKDAQILVRDPLGSVIGHGASIVVLLTNLISNALKFVQAGVQPKVEIWTEDVDSMVRLHVRDNGIGIAQKDLGRLFGVFQRLRPQREYPGSGLGLAIVHKAVERMGGRAGVESTPGTGSVFWIELKRSGAPPDAD